MPGREVAEPASDDPARVPTSTTGAAASTSARSTRRLYDPIYKYWFRVEWEGLRAPPRRRRRAARRQPRGRDPARRARRSCTASRPSSAGRCTASPRTCSARCRSSARCGRAAAASPPTPTTRTGSCTTSSSSCSCSPKARRRPASVYRERYQLRRFGRGGFVEIAMRAGRAGDPDRGRSARRSRCRSCSRARGSRRCSNIPYFPITANMLADRARPGSSRTSPPSSGSACCRRCTSTSPPEPGALLAQPRDGGVRTHPPHGAGRALRHAAHPPQRVVRLSGATRARPRHRAVTYWGGRVAQALEQRPDVEVVVGLDTRIRACRSSAPSSCGPTRRTRSSPASCARRRSTPIVHTHLIVDSTRVERPRAARDQRHRDDEPARGGRARREPGAQGRAEELGARVRRRTTSDPYFFREDMTRTRSARAPPSNARCSRSKRSSATSPTTTRTSTSRCCGSRTCSATTSTRRSPPRCGAASCPRSSASTRACSSCTRTTWSARLMYAATQRHARRVQRRPATATCRGARCARSSASGASRCRRVLTSLAAEPMRMLRLVGSPARGDAAAALRPLDRQHPLQARRLPLRVHERGHGRGVRARAAAGRRGRRHQPDVPVRARRRGLLPPLARGRPTRNSDGTHPGS